jgi:hypothetical protein
VLSAEDLAKRVQRTWNDPKERPAAALLALDQACGLKDLQVMADRGLAETQRLGEVTDTGFAARLRLDQAEQAEARRIGQHLERCGQLLGLLGLDRLLKKRRAGGRDPRDRLHERILTEIDDLSKMPSISVDT